MAMNRFVIGGILAAMVLLLTGGLNRLFADRRSDGQLPRAQRTTTDVNGGLDDLGSLPIEQAGQLVRRQSDLGAGGTTRTTGDTVFGDSGAQGMPAGGRATISPTGTAGAQVAPAQGNVIPRTGTATTFPTGDIAPIQPGLVQPGEVQRPAPDPDLDSIPALW
jgi:hypothetical protein